MGTLIDMATFTSGGNRRATANTKTAMARSAANRQCPQCDRKAALKFISDAEKFGSLCRWCGYDSFKYRRG